MPHRNRSPVLRRTLLELVQIFNERTDVIVKALAILLVVSLALQRFWKMYELVERVLTVLHFIVAIGVVAYFVGRRILLKDSTRLWSLVLSKQDWLLLRERLRAGMQPAGADGVCLTEFPSRASLEALVDMNYHGFKDTAFAVERERLLRRDAIWIEKNPRIFMLMRDPIFQRDYIGYSALVPLNADGAELYLSGKLKDADIPAALLCTPEERPAAIVIFAIVLKEEFSFSRKGAARQYSKYFWNCVEHHIREIYPDLFKALDYPPLYGQAERKRMRDRMESLGFRATGVESADGFELWVIENAARPPAELPAVAERV